MKETPSTPTLAPTPTWSITKAEWDALASRYRSLSIQTWVSVGLMALFGVGLLIAAPSLPASPAIPPLGGINRFVMTAGGLLLFVAVVQYLWFRRAAAAWDMLHVQIWESDGCVCPWCRERVDISPCSKHGFTGAEHELLLRYWESMALQDSARALETRLKLRTLRRRSTALSRAWSVITGPFLRYAAAVNREDATPLERLRAALPGIVVVYALLAALVVIVWHIDRRAPVHDPRFVCMMVLLAPVMAIAGPMWRSHGLRCRKCGQLCASSRPTLCAECGSDLTLPASVSRTERRRAPFMLMASTLILLFPAYLGIGWLMNSVVSALPGSLQNRIYWLTKPPVDHFAALHVETMTQQEIDHALDLLIDCAAPGGPRIFDDDFLPEAMAAGKVSGATIERAVRSIVQAELRVARDGDAVVATVYPAFGEPILGSSTTPRLVFGGVSIDGGPWTKGSDWSLSDRDLDEFWRMRAGDETLPAPLPEAQLVFTARIDGVQMGTHAVRARCWIVVSGNSWERYTPTFDENGVLVPPDGSKGIYPLDLEATVSVGR